MARATRCLSCVAPSAPQYKTYLRSNTPALLGERKYTGLYRCSVTENGLVRNILGYRELRNCRSTALNCDQSQSPRGGARSRSLRRQRETPAAWAASTAAAVAAEAAARNASNNRAARRHVRLNFSGLSQLLAQPTRTFRNRGVSS